MISNTTNMTVWGWKDFFQQQIKEESPDKIARVIKEQRDHLILTNGHGEMIGGIISGNWKKRRDDFENPSVGDWVVVDEKINDREGIPYFRISQRLDRFSQILRKAAGPKEKSQLLAANVDVAFLVQSSNHDLDVRRLERYLSLLGDGMIKPVLVLTKSDLDGSANCQKELEQRFPQIPLLITRSDEPTSIQALTHHLGCGMTSVFLGSSGVGKSTLTNLLLRSPEQLVQDIRKNDSKGRHTTTGRSMFLLADNQGLIIDTPGLREIKLPQTENNFEEAFADILEIALNCRFANCLHKSEPQCAVKEAVKQGVITEDKLTHYQKLRDETKRKSYHKGKS